MPFHGHVLVENPDITFAGQLGASWIQEIYFYGPFS